MSISLPSKAGSRRPGGRPPHDVAIPAFQQGSAGDRPIEQERIERLLAERQDADRQRIGRDLHDTVGQALTAIRLNLLAAQPRVDDPEARQRVASSLQAVDEAMAAVRGLAREIRSDVSPDVGLAATIRSYLRGHPGLARVTVMIDIGTLPPLLPVDVERACLRIVQEAVTNVVRHARARDVSVSLHARRSTLVLSVSDNGTGLSPATLVRAATQGHLGVTAIYERARLAGGTATVSGVPGAGTTVRATFPIGPARRTTLAG